MDVTVRGLTERDIDLLLLEELVHDNGFLRWFLESVGVGGAGQVTGAARSVTTSTGESDLELTIRHGSRVTRLLIENKIDAVLQPRQGERYRERAKAYVDNGECDQAVAILIAPEAYGDRSRGFDRALSYEAVLAALSSGSGEDARRRYKLYLLRRAIDEANVPGPPDAAATRFWREYWELSRTIAPELHMPEPGEKPATSNFIRFDPAELGPEVELIHKVPYGHVDLQFGGAAAKLAMLRDDHRAHLDRDMRIERAHKSVVIRIRVKKTHVRAPFSEAEVAATEAFAAAQRLLEWYVRWMWPPESQRRDTKA